MELLFIINFAKKGKILKVPNNKNVMTKMLLHKNNILLVVNASDYNQFQFSRRLESKYLYM